MNTEESKNLLQPFDQSNRPSAAIFRPELRLVAGAIFLMNLGLAEALAHPGLQRQVDPESGITTYSFVPATGLAGTKHEPPPAPHPAPASTASPTITAPPKEVENKIARSIARSPSSLRDFRA